MRDQAGGGGFAVDGAAGSGQRVASVQAGIHLHNSDAGFGVARLDRPLNRCRAPPARQQRSMDIEAAEAWQVQHRLGQNQSVGYH